MRYKKICNLLVAWQRSARPTGSWVSWIDKGKLDSFLFDKKVIKNERDYADSSLLRFLRGRLRSGNGVGDMPLSSEEDSLVVDLLAAAWAASYSTAPSAPASWSS